MSREPDVIIDGLIEVLKLPGAKLLLAVESFESDFYMRKFSFPSLDETSSKEQIELELKKYRELFQLVSKNYSRVLQAPGGKISSQASHTDFKNDSIKKLETMKEDVTLAINYLLQILIRINNQTQLQISKTTVKIAKYSLFFSLLATAISIASIFLATFL